MLKFVFLLTLWTSESNIPQVSVADYSLTGEDCISRMVEYIESDPMESRGAASCELDQGEPWDELTSSGIWDESGPFNSYAVEHEGNFLILPACKYEDSDSCVWDAAFMGNGMGESFYVYQGKRYPVSLE